MCMSKIADQLVTVLRKFTQNIIRKLRYCSGKFRFGWVAASTRNKYSYKVPSLSRIHLQCPPIMFAVRETRPTIVLSYGMKCRKIAPSVKDHISAL